MILFVDKNSGILFIKTGVGFIPVFIPLEHTLGDLVETIPGPLTTEILVDLFEKGKFRIETIDPKPITGLRIVMPREVIIKVFPSPSGVESIEGIEIPGIWGYLFDEKPDIIEVEKLDISLIGNVKLFYPELYSEKENIPTIIETTEGT